MGKDEDLTSFRDLKRLCVGPFAQAFDMVNSRTLQGDQIPMEIFHCLLHSCMEKKNLEAGRKLHLHILQSASESSTLLQGELIRMFAMCESLFEASLVFSQLDEPESYMWRVIISAHDKLGHGSQAIKLYTKLHESSIEPNGYVFVAAIKACSNTLALDEGKRIHSHIIKSGFELDMFVGSTLIDMYIQCGRINDACLLFDKFPKRDAVIWSAMISGFTCHGHDEKALKLFQEMHHKGIELDSAAFVSALKASSSMGALDEGKLIHFLVMDSGHESDAYVGSALISMYAKSGSLEDAHTVFTKSSKKNPVTWNALITGCALHSKYKLAVQYFEDMQVHDVKPDGVTFLGVLSACGHLGRVEEGYRHFKSMIEVYGITPLLEHYNCLVDILGRGGCMVEAERLLQNMPYQSNIVGWKALLNYCHLHGNVELGKHCFHHIAMIDPKHSSGYVLLSNTYADAGLWDDVCKIEELRRCTCAVKTPGKAFIEVQSKVHEFLAGDKSHVQNDDIYQKMMKLYLQMRYEGYFPCMDLIVQLCAN